VVVSWFLWWTVSSWTLLCRTARSGRKIHGLSFSACGTVNPARLLARAARLGDDAVEAGVVGIDALRWSCRDRA